MIPQGASDGKKVNVSQFRFFGLVTFSHVPQKLRKKIDDRSERCILVGYSEESKAYILYNPLTKKFVLNRDVKFSENKSWLIMLMNPQIRLFIHHNHHDCRFNKIHTII